MFQWSQNRTVESTRIDESLTVNKSFTPFPPMKEDVLEDDPLPDHVPVEPEQDSRKHKN